MSLCARCRRDAGEGGIRVGKSTLVPLCDDCVPAVETLRSELALAIAEVLR